MLICVCSVIQNVVHANSNSKQNAVQGFICDCANLCVFNWFSIKLQACQICIFVFLSDHVLLSNAHARVCLCVRVQFYYFSYNNSEMMHASFIFDTTVLLFPIASTFTETHMCKNGGVSEVTHFEWNKRMPTHVPPPKKKKKKEEEKALLYYVQQA